MPDGELQQGPKGAACRSRRPALIDEEPHPVGPEPLPDRGVWRQHFPQAGEKPALQPLAHRDMKTRFGSVEVLAGKKP